MPRKKAESGPQGLNATIAKLQKQFGDDSIIRMGDAPRKSIEVIPTEIAAIDIALGRGGFPKGRVIEIYGPESSGKTSLALRVVASAQKRGGNCVFIDAEHALDPEYAANIGVNVDDLYVSQPNNGEQALELAKQLASSGEVSVIVVDSVSALTPKSELEGEIGDANVGKQARLMSQALRMLTPVVSDTNTILIFINQLREKVGVMFGSPETTSGGKSLKFYSSVRIDVRRTGNISNDKDSIGSTTRIKVVKNKVAPPFKTAEVETYYGVGISREESVIEEGVKYGLVEKAGAWYTFGEQRFQGKKGFIAQLENDPELLDTMYNTIMSAALTPTEPEQDEEVEVEETVESDSDDAVDQFLSDDDETIFDK